MTLTQFLAALSGNKGTQVTLIDAEQTELLTFNIEGYEAVESDILALEVDNVVITKTPNTIQMKVYLKAVETTNPSVPGTGD